MSLENLLISFKIRRDINFKDLRTKYVYELLKKILFINIKFETYKNPLGHN